MPGILPMKVIKVGSTSQSRVAQACDRCRSKKIRCDGTTPCCSQCANVGFECKTSDKLSRRAFPRGYTESLEERVRSLESEVRELKDLLDTKDEKIDLLSRIRSNSPVRKQSPNNPPERSFTPSQSFGMDNGSSSADGSVRPADGQDELLSIPSSAAASSGKPFVDAFRNDLKARSPQVLAFKAQDFFESRAECPVPGVGTASAAPSRMASDQMINIFLQEWLPLFPILHRPNVLKIYSSFVAEPESFQSHHDIAQLYLIFGIASISAEGSDIDHRSFEGMWKPALEIAVKQISVPSLQCLLLASLYCTIAQDHQQLRKIKALSAKLSRRLGLHQAQKRSSLGPLTTETRKRLFWTLFTLDCFSSAILGQSRALRDVDIACEFPQDIDDENITDESFLVPTPGESTRISSGLAIFRGVRTMADILDTIYPPAPTHRIAVAAIGSLSEQLDSWFAGLPPYLHLNFMQEKPSTAVTGSRSPFLSLMYHYLRTLLYRPLFLAPESPRSSAALVVLAQSSKHIVQIIQLLKERHLSFSFCLNKHHTLIMAGFGLLYSNLRSNRGSKLVQDSQQYLHTICSILGDGKSLHDRDFRSIVAASTSASMPSWQDRAGFNRPFNLPKEIQNNRMRKGTLNMSPRQRGRHSPHKRSSSTKHPRVKVEPQDESLPIKVSVSDSQLSGTLGLLSQNAPRLFAPRPLAFNHRPHSFPIASNPSPGDLPNLDFLDFGSEPSSATELSDVSKPLNFSSGLLGPPQTLDDGFSPNGFTYLSGPDPSDPSLWPPEVWNSSLVTDRMQPGSSLSLSEESLTSGEDLSSCGSQFVPQEFLTMAR